MTRFVCFGVMSNDISDHKAWSHTTHDHTRRDFFSYPNSATFRSNEVLVVMSLNNPAGALGPASGSYITMGENYYIFKNATRIQRDGDGVGVLCASWGSLCWETSLIRSI